MGSRNIHKTIAKLMDLSLRSAYPPESVAARRKAEELARRYGLDARCAPEPVRPPQAERERHLVYDWLTGQFYDRRTGRGTDPAVC